MEKVNYVVEYIQLGVMNATSWLSLRSDFGWLKADGVVLSLMVADEGCCGLVVE